MRDYVEECRTCECGSDCGMYIDSEEIIMANGITKDTFDAMDIDSKLGVLFDYMHDIQMAAPRRVKDRDIKCAKQITECNKKFTGINSAINKNRILNTAAAAVGGFIGGWAAFLVSNGQLFGG